MSESSIDEAQVPLFSEESISLAGAIEKRRREFIAGRTCARRALAHLGGPMVPIPIGADRSPVWPVGFVGSITHGETLAAAAVGRSSDFLSVGIDLEGIGRVTPELYSVLFGADEQTWLQTLPLTSREVGSTALFCAKEAFYKFQYPVTKTFLEFTDVAIRIDLETWMFEVTVLANKVPQRERVEGCHGRIAVTDRWVYAAVWKAERGCVESDETIRSDAAEHPKPEPS